MISHMVDSSTRRIDLNDASLTENTRAAYPISHTEGALRTGHGGHPKNIIMLTCDAFGVMPPIARLTPDQAMYHFLSGYTAKVPGTERGMDREPTATFSTCFGAPFMALPPSVYARLLGEKIARHGVSCWLLHTGWSDGPYGVGKRIEIAHTRAMVRSALAGRLADVPMKEDAIFGLAVPERCDGVPADVLEPKKTWRDPSAYEAMARELAASFAKNFAQYEAQVPAEVRSSGPRAS